MIFSSLPSCCSGLTKIPVRLDKLVRFATVTANEEVTVLCLKYDCPDGLVVRHLPHVQQIGDNFLWFVCWLVVYHPSNRLVYLRNGSAHNFTCCHTETEVADPTFCLTLSQCTDITQGSYWSANFYVTGTTRHRKIPMAIFCGSLQS